MKQIQRLITLVILVGFSSCADQEEKILSSSACYGINLPCTSHHLRCSGGSLITIVSAQYGYKHRCGVAVECTACCWYGEGDCMVEYKSSHYMELFKNCSLQTECSFRAPWISHTVCSDIHRSFLTSTFSFISYKCVDVFGIGSNTNRQEGLTTQSIDLGSTKGVADVISELSDHPQRRFRYNNNQDSINEDSNTVTVIVIMLTVAIVAVVVLALLIKFGCCKRLLSAISEHLKTHENTDQENGDQDCNENETSGYSVVNTTKQTQNHTNVDKSVHGYNDDPFKGYSVINASKHKDSDSPISLLETHDVSSGGNHGNYPSNMADPLYEYFRNVDDSYNCDNFDSVITPVDNSHIYSVVNKTKPLYS